MIIFPGTYCDSRPWNRSVGPESVCGLWHKPDLRAELQTLWRKKYVLLQGRKEAAYSALRAGRKGFSQSPLYEHQISRISSVILTGWKYFTQTPK